MSEKIKDNKELIRLLEIDNIAFPTVLYELEKIQYTPMESVISYSSVHKSSKFTLDFFYKPIETII